MIICSDEVYKEAAEFYAEKLNIPETTIVAIGLYPQLEVAGYCEYRTEEVIPYFIVGLETGEECCEDPLSVLAHEMVHVKQYVTGELIDQGSHSNWKGSIHKEYEANSEEYFFSPWEIEAFGMQVGLYRMYCRSMEE